MRYRYAAIALAIAMTMGGCSLLEVLAPGPRLAPYLPAGPLYDGDDAATLVVETRQEGCCYIEGAQRYVLLDGPTEVEWAVDDGSGSRDDPEDFLVGSQSLQIQPGHYVLTEWERVCGGNCGPDFIGDPQNQCSIGFEVLAGARIEMQVVFRIFEPGPCTIET